MLGKEPKQRDGRFCSPRKSDELTKDRTKGLVEHCEPNERVPFRMGRAGVEELANTIGEPSHASDNGSRRSWIPERV